MKRRIIIIGIMILLAVGGYFVYSSIARARQAASSQYQTVALERGELTAIIGATGTVHANQTGILAWQTNGLVENVTVKVGDVVQTDQELASLRQSSLPQTIILAQADLVTARKALDDLQSSGVATAQAQLALEQAEEAYEEAEKNLTRKDFRRSSDATLDAARANYVLAQDAYEQAQELFSAVADRDENDVTRAQLLSQLSAAEQARDRALANLNYLLGTPDEQERQQAEAELEVARANLEAAQREWDRLKNGADPDDIAAAESRVAALEATLEMAVLKAPFNGTVTSVEIKSGDQVAPGSPAFRIDDFSRLLVDVLVPEVDINRIQVGQSAQISFDAIQDNTYTGEVVEVARVGETDPASGSVNFNVTIELQDADERVLPGMTAAVTVVVNQQEDVLLVPNRAVRLREGERVVYILRDGMPVMEPIEIGNTSETVSEVVSGNVSEGDLVILNPPSNLQGGPMFGR